jgi:hypothetical protein
MATEFFAFIAMFAVGSIVTFGCIYGAVWLILWAMGAFND